MGEEGPCPNAFRAACIAKDCWESALKGCELGGLGIVARAGDRGEEEGGGGGAEGGVGAVEDWVRGIEGGGGGAEGGTGATDGGCGGGGGATDGFRDVTGGGSGGLDDPGKGGGTLGGIISALELGL